MKIIFRVRATSVNRHPTNDVAILKFSQRIAWTSKVAPICWGSTETPPSKALLASWAQLASSGLFLTEARAERARKADNEELLFQLEPGHVFSTHNSGII